MKTPKQWYENLKIGLITDDMLEAALYSVNKRAKNYRNKKREYSHYRYAQFDYAGSAEQRMNEMYAKKDLLLTLLPPVCIHIEYQNNKHGKRVEIKQDVETYMKWIYTGEITHYGSFIRRHHNEDGWNDPYDEEYVDFFDHSSQPFTKAYYLFRVLGEHSFHTPINESELDQYSYLPIVVIDQLITDGDDIHDLCSMYFVNKLLDLIQTGDYYYDRRDHVDRDYLNTVEPVNIDHLIESKYQENTVTAVEYFCDQIANAMEQKAEKMLRSQAKREQPNAEEINRWDRLVKKQYDKNIQIIQRCLKKPNKYKMKKAKAAIKSLEEGDLNLSSVSPINAYEDYGALMDFIDSTAYLYEGLPNITINKMINDFPPREQSILKDEEQYSRNYIRQAYRELIQEKKAEIKELINELEQLTMKY